jgi:hypothetical protein
VQAVSLLVPSAADDIDNSIDMVEIRCQVANVTRRSFTE